MSDWRKSSYSTINGCVEVAWRKATASGHTGCVEVAVDGPAVLVRNSRDPDGARLTFTLHEWAVFVEGVKAGEFDR